MNKAYKDLVDGLAAVGTALIAIGEDKKAAPIKLLVSELVTKLNLNNPAAVDTLIMLRYAVDNEDESLEKLTAYITSAPVEEPTPAAPVEDVPAAPVEDMPKVEEPKAD